MMISNAPRRPLSQDHNEPILCMAQSQHSHWWHHVRSLEEATVLPLTQRSKKTMIWKRSGWIFVGTLPKCVWIIRFQVSCCWLMILYQRAAQGQTTGFKQAPSETFDVFEDHAKVTNVPEIGCRENHIFTAQQLNDAPAVLSEVGELTVLDNHLIIPLMTVSPVVELRALLGKFEGGHIDSRDALAAFNLHAHTLTSSTRLRSRIHLSIGIWSCVSTTQIPYNRFLQPPLACWYIPHRSCWDCQG